MIAIQLYNQAMGCLMDKMVCNLENPWSGSMSTMTWAEVKNWAHEHVNERDLSNWLRHARKAVHSGNAEKLGAMIIGA